MDFLTKPLKYFSYTALKPWHRRINSLDEMMHMDRIMSIESENWSKANDKIPAWFYQMIVYMGLAVSTGFILIFLGSL